MKQIQGKIYIIGAGFAGKMICREIKEKGIFGEVAAFLDDDTSKIGTKISGIPVIGPVMEIIPVLKHEAQDEALIAIPSAEKAYLSKLYTQLKKSTMANGLILLKEHQKFYMLKNQCVVAFGM